MIHRFPDKAKRPVSDSTSVALHGSRFESDLSNALASGRIERLLQGANEAIALPHRLRLIDLEARHRLAQYRSHYNPNQPRVPAGHPDGGQWTATGGGSGTRLAAADKPRPGRGGIIAIAVQLALRAIEAYRVKERLWDLLGNKERSAIAVATIDGRISSGPTPNRAYTLQPILPQRRNCVTPWRGNIRPNFPPRISDKHQTMRCSMPRQPSC